MTQHTIPDQMTAVVLDSYDGVDALRVEQRPVPKPGPNQVLVKVAAAAINPSDVMFIEGRYGFRKPTPTVPGFEGSGTVVAVGGGMMGRYLANKRVACVTQDRGDGLWAEYVLTASSFALPLANDVSLEQGAMSVVNPMTVVAMLETAKQGRHKTIINTAAASALGQMLNRLGKLDGIQVINIVRREGQVELLKQQGASIVLNSSEADFEQQLRDACYQHDARLAFDAIAGATTMQLLHAMPNGGRVLVYGALSEQPSQAIPTDLIFKGKVLEGFWLTAWVSKKNIVQSLLLWRRAQKLMNTALKSEVRARYGLHDAKAAIQDYQAQMTGGKILITPDA